jgi:hypothetical protein
MISLATNGPGAIQEYSESISGAPTYVAYNSFKLFITYPQSAFDCLKALMTHAFGS